jgi:hypothetical protein
MTPPAARQGLRPRSREEWVETPRREQLGKADLRVPQVPAAVARRRELAAWRGGSDVPDASDIPVCGPLGTLAFYKDVHDREYEENWVYLNNSSERASTGTFR